MRAALLRLLRATHLIQFADRIAAHRAVHANVQANADYRAAHPKRAFPDPALVFEVAGHAKLKSFDLSGQAHAREIACILRENALAASPSILDWGCGPARILAHLPAVLNAPDARFHGCDPNPRAIAYARAALAHISFEHSPATPPLPYAAESFDAIYGVSILTHLPEAQAQSWVAELARVVRNDGVVLLSAHGANAAARLPAPVRARFDAGDYVEAGGAKAGSRTYVSYFNETAGRRLFAPYFAEVVHRSANAVIGHDLCLLRAPRRSGKA
ncbi:class I SAM-dependent methyltransferase [Terricaulis silvestris]|uniref:Polypeptide chain release factor methylase n=1 Tax=Terricaulis silvestris TaxID=2686094 RepID=A0A6I6MW23_9CAUL|nr:class I SAM-dependent methyltransferase [Terricaulis silvestris]QGZ95363.1 polypeptide chain release factor methylase [Terricaulis silvestris]